MSVITLLSDLGTQDATVSVAKAILLRHVPDAYLVDISHKAEQFDLQQAAYLLLSAYKYFPAGSIHVLLVDVFSADMPRMLVAEKDGYFFIAPDNGVLALAFGETLMNTRLCLQFKKPFIFRDWIESAGKVAAQLPEQEGDINFQPCEVKTTPRLLQPKVMPDGVDCNIMYIDRYENVVLDITREQFEELVQERPFRIKIMRAEDITTISSNYNDVKNGEPLCRFNNAGFLEIAFNHAPAATFLGLGSFSTGNLRYQTIKIFFR
jgi:S-adenosylmethionine hydrolase